MGIERGLGTMHIHQQSFRRALSLIIARADSNRINITPVTLLLWVLLGISINLNDKSKNQPKSFFHKMHYLAGGGKENAGSNLQSPFCQTHGSNDRDLPGTNRIGLIEGRRGGTGQMIDLVCLGKLRKGENVCFDKLD